MYFHSITDRKEKKIDGRIISDFMLFASVHRADARFISD